MTAAMMRTARPPMTPPIIGPIFDLLFEWVISVPEPLVVPGELLPVLEGLDVPVPLGEVVAEATLNIFSKSLSTQPDFGAVKFAFPLALGGS